MRIFGGVTRHVFRVGNWAVKIPRLNYTQKLFLLGLLASHQEVRVWRMLGHPSYLCPVLFSLPLGLLVVMPWAEVSGIDDWEGRDQNKPEAFDEADWHEMTRGDNCGFLGDRFVVVDYGGFEG